MSLVWGWSLPATDKLVALKLADCADDQGRNAWPAVATIAADCGLSRRGTQEVLRRLVRRGCIEVQAGSTNRKSTTYRVLLVSQVPSGGEDEGGGSPEVGGAPDAPPGANDVHPQGRTPCAGGAQLTTSRGAPDAPLGAHPVRPIRPGSVRDPSCDPSRAREGHRPHPLDEPGVVLPRVLALFDELFAAYPRKDDRFEAQRVWRELNLPIQQAEFVVAHVRMRVNAGWVRHAGGPRFVPKLWRFLERRSWLDHGESPSLPLDTSLEGMRTVRCCDKCGAELEGRVVNGKSDFPPCSRCARVSGGSRSPARRQEPHV